MNKLKGTVTTGIFALGLLILSAVLPVAGQVQAAAVDPVATQTLRQMTEYLGGLQTFTVHTQSTLEDTLDSGHRIDLDVSANVTIDRPNRLHAERKGELVDQAFYYNGKTLTLYNPAAKVYATEKAPDTIEGTLDFTRESLGLMVPVADLIYRQAFSLLMQNVTLAVVVGKSVINGVVCHHLLFSKPGVDFQVWVAQGDKPLPYKYVVTDTQTPMGLSTSTVMGDWNTSPAVDDARFTFIPPKDAKPIDFMPL